MKRNLHMVLQGKGGVGKSTISSFLGQYYEDNGYNYGGIDTDQINASFYKFKRLKVETLDIIEDNKIRADGWDYLVEKILDINNINKDFIIDNGASSFLPLLDYIKKNKTIDLLKEYEKNEGRDIEVYFHLIVAGGEALMHCMNGISSIVSQFKNEVKYIIWLNNPLGIIEHNGRPLIESDIIQDNTQYLTGIIEIPTYDADTFGRDIEKMLKNNFTFKEMINDSSVTIASKQRYKIVQTNIYSMIDKLDIVSEVAMNITIHKKKTKL